MESTTSGAGDRTSGDALNQPGPGRHALRDQDVLWSDLLVLAASVVTALEKSIQAICDNRFELISEVANDEAESDRREVRIEQECMRILALYEPVASDLRRMATALKVNRDWERIADLALRVARRARKLSRQTNPVAIPESLKILARDVLSQVRTCYQSLARRDLTTARELISGDAAINRQYRALRKELKSGLAEHPAQLESWLQLMNAARNLERIADHASSIAKCIVFLEEGVIVRHSGTARSAND
jgi:phosphate transport system protein